MESEEIRQELQEIKQGIATVNSNLERIEGLLEELKPDFKLTGRLDLDNAEFNLHLTAWNQVIGELQLIKVALSRIK